MKGPSTPRQQRDSEWVPIQVEFEGWPLMPPPIVVDSANVNYFVRLNHAWRHALPGALAATILYYETPELIHNHGSTVSDDFAVLWLKTLQSRHNLGQCLPAHIYQLAIKESDPLGSSTLLPV